MSFFGRKSAEPAPPTPPQFDAASASTGAGAGAGAGASVRRSAGVIMATSELEAMTNLFHKLTDTCFDKCITKHNSAELQIGELACDDRCAIKYMEAQTIIAEVFKKQNAAQQQQQQAAAAAVPQ